ncbi:unnamed protein product, partial [Brenthis ino]
MQACWVHSTKTIHSFDDFICPRIDALAIMHYCLPFDSASSTARDIALDRDSYICHGARYAAVRGAARVAALSRLREPSRAGRSRHIVALPPHATSNFARDIPHHMSTISLADHS